MTHDRAVSFYSGGDDHRGRTLDQILAWSDEHLESTHDYIQWMFPTVVPSGVNRHAPLVTDVTRKAFDERPELRDRLRRSLDRMLAFYGLRRESGANGTPRIVIDEAGFSERKSVWLWPGNHNHLRLTRIMQSLAALGLHSEAAALQRCLVSDVFEGPGDGRITDDTYEYWITALSS